MDSLSYMVEKLAHLQRKYSAFPRYCALRMLLTSLKALVVKNQLSTLFSKQSQHLDKGLTVVFSIKGGLGDCIVAVNFISCFCKYLEGIPFKLKIVYHSKELLDAFCSSLPNLSQLETRLADAEGNLIIELNRFPRILLGDIEEISSFSPRLGLLLVVWKKFFIKNHKLFDMMPMLDSVANNYSVITGKKRLSQGDIGGLLNISEQYMAHIPIKLEESSVLKQFNLANKKYITIQRGQSLTETGFSNNKLWPLEYYNTLTSLLKKQYPNYLLVQLGVQREGFNDDFESIDINLRGKNNLEELKVILKNASLHIDSEGGLVHLRHALNGGPSVVLFGPTDPNFYGYSENLNLRSEKCTLPCEWLANDWLTYCVNPRKNICLKQLTPEFVMSKIALFMQNASTF